MELAGFSTDSMIFPSAMSTNLKSSFKEIFVFCFCFPVYKLRKSKQAERMVKWGRGSQSKS